MRFFFLAVALVIAVVGFIYTAGARSRQADAAVLLVVATYPGASAQVVADTVAAPIEQQINGVERLARMESTSGNDGKFTATLFFEARTDLTLAMKLVQNRAALAEPILPDAVRGNKVNVTMGKAEGRQNKVTIAVIDRGSNDWKALQTAAEAVVKRLVTANALTKPRVFPQDEKHNQIDVNRERCNSLGVTLSEVFQAVKAAGVEMQPEELKKIPVRDKVSLGDVVTIKEVDGPSAIYRIDLYPAIQITGAPAGGASAGEAASTCADLAQAEMKRLGLRGYVVENLSAK